MYESDLSEAEIRGCYENTLVKSFEMRPHVLYLKARIDISLWPSPGSGLDTMCPYRDIESLHTY